MVLGPKYVVAIMTEEEEEDCCVDGIIVKLIISLYTCNRMQITTVTTMFKDT
jgi:hypothetical protein